MFFQNGIPGRVYRSSKIAAIALSLVVGAALISTAVAVAPVAEAALPSAKLPAKTDTCAGVWVVVDTGSATTVRCATSYASGSKALTSAGYSVKKDAQWGMVCQINSNPSTCGDGTNGYWSYWSAKRNSNGSWSKWKEYGVGAADSKPVKGDAEGWSWTVYPQQKAPRILPPKGFTKATIPTISGTAKVGKKLIAQPGFTPKASYSYQWYRNGKAIKSATKASYTAVKADKGKRITVKVTAKKAGYETTQLESKAKTIS